MNDKELLELAAKAIGLKLKYNYLGGRDANQPWDPLEDDGDALRLAVKLKLDIEFHEGDDRTPPGVTANTYKFELHGAAENIALNPDLLCATRRAITRAAAEIGKNLGKVPIPN